MSTPFRLTVRVLSLVVGSAILVTLVSGCANLPGFRAGAGPEGPATISGKAISDRGAVLADASVTLSGPSLRRTTTTDIGGRFQFERVPLGRFAVSVSATGYKTAKQTVVVDKETVVQVDVQVKM